MPLFSHVFLGPVEPSPGTAASTVPSTRHTMLPRVCTPHLYPCNPALCESAMQPRNSMNAAGWGGPSRGRKTPHRPLSTRFQVTPTKVACERGDWLREMGEDAQTSMPLKLSKTAAAHWPGPSRARADIWAGLTTVSRDWGDGDGRLKQPSGRHCRVSRFTKTPRSWLGKWRARVDFSRRSPDGGPLSLGLACRRTGSTGKTPWQ